MRTRFACISWLVGFLFLSQYAYAQPANDACANAINIPNVNNFCSAVGAGTNVNATDDIFTGGYAEASCQGAGVQDVWYSFVATATDVTISIIGNTAGGTSGGTLDDPEVIIYEGTCAGMVTEMVCGSDVTGTNLVEVYQGGLTPGETYLVRVDGRNGSEGTFQFCINNYNPPADPQSDCPNAVVLCDKSNFTVPSIVGAGNDNTEMDDATCFGGGAGLETNSTWYTWTAANNGTLSFTLTPTNPNDDLDFVVYELPNGVGDCTGKIVIRCMASGDLSSANSPCMGPTGLNDTSTDVSEDAGCTTTFCGGIFGVECDDNFLQELNMTAGTTYALGINNFTSTGNGFNLEFGGTGEFVGPVSDFTVDPDSVCTDEIVTITDNSSFPGGAGFINGWEWNFGVDAVPATASTQGPHNVSYTTSGPKIITLTVMSDEGCLITSYQTIQVENCCSVDAAVSAFTDPSCGGMDGSLSINVNNATPPITYDWNPNVSITNTANNLAAGTYTIIVVDANMCTDTITYTLNTSNGPSIDNIAVEDENCGMGNGSLTITVSGGATPYLYSVNGGTTQTSNVFTGLGAGIYTVVVSDANSCSATMDAMVSNLPGVVLDIIQIQNTSCGNSNGSITVTALGGNQPYQYSIDNGTTFQGSNTFTGLAANTYPIVVMDADGCMDNDVAIVADEPGPAITNVATNDPTCGNNDGSITVTATGGTVPLTYSINGGTAQASGTFTGLGQGSYTILVTDANGCTATDQASLNDLGGPSISNIAVTASSCSASDGTITVTVTGGTTPLQYSIDNGTPQATGLFTGLAAGTYNVLVEDVNGCSDNGVAVIVDQPGATINGVAVTEPTCGNANGSFTINATGNGPLQYSISGGGYGASPTFGGLPNGTYPISVLDDNGCTTDGSVTLNGDLGPTISTTVTQPSCGEDNGEIVVLATGGTAPFMYSVNGGTLQTSSTFLDLPANTYMVMVSDGNGCTASTSVTLNPSTGPAISSIKSNPTSCNFNNGSLEIFAGGGTPPLSYSINNGISFQPNPLFTGLAPGTYYIVVEDANGCQVEEQEDVLPSNPVQIDFLTPVHPTCGQDNGSITVAIGSGTSPYQYSIDGGLSYQSGNVFTGLGSGFYTVLIQDDAGCTDTESINLNTSSGVVIDNITAYNGTCGVQNGIIDIDASGGVLNYQYSIDGGVTFQSSSVFANLPSGTYNVVVMDAVGCSVAAQASLTNATAAMIDAVNTVDPSSCGTFDGSIDILASGGSPPYQYSVNNGMTYQATGNFPGLGANTYNVVIKDAQGCLDTTIVVLNDLNAPVIDNVVSVNPTCGQGNGSIEVLVSGGNPNYEYSIDGGTTFQGSNIFMNLTAGAYTIIVEDFLGCRTSSQVTLLFNGAPQIDNIFVTNTSCAEVNGSIQVIASGGTFPYQYSNDGGLNFQLPATFPNVLAGTYVIVVLDAAGCTATDQVTVADNGDVQIDNVLTQAPSTCAGEDGTINIIASGGQGPYEFSIDNGMTFQSTGFYVDLPSGTYNIVVRDINGCEKTQVVTLEGLDPPIIDDINYALPTCGSANGSIEVLVSGGTPNYQYSIDGGITYQGSNVFVGLPAAVYYVVVVDANGCEAIESINLVNPGEPTINNILVTNPACGNTPGSLEILASGGTTPYSYSIDNGTTFQAGNYFQNLAAGIYDVVVMDGGGCQTNASVTLIDNGELLINATNLTQPTCEANDGAIDIQVSGGTAPYMYSVDNGINYQGSATFTGLAGGLYNIAVMDAAGCMTLATATLNSNGNPSIDQVSVSPASCGADNGIIDIDASAGTGPYQYSIDGGATFQGLDIFQNLPGAVYIVVVRDLNGCEASRTVLVGSSLQPSVNILASGDPVFCEGETILLNAGIWTGYIWSTGEGTQVIEAGATGTYEVTVSDANGCFGTGSIDVVVNQAAQVDAVEIDEMQLGDTDSVSVLFIDPDVDYSWAGSDGSTFDGPTFIFEPTATGAYTFVVTATNDNCPSYDTLNIIVLDRSAWEIPNAFTPNGDDLNDGFGPSISGGFSVDKFIIFNRWGEKVHDDISGKWDGTFRGKAQPKGVYAYVIVVKDLEGKLETRSGEVHLLR